MQQQLKQCMVSVQGQPKNLHALENLKWLYRVHKNKKHTEIREIRDDNWLVRVKFKIWQNIHILRWFLISMWTDIFSVCLCLQSGIQTRLEQTSNVLNDEVLTQYFVMYCRLTLLLQDQVNNFGLYCRLTQTLDDRTEVRIEKIILKHAICHLRSKLQWAFLTTCCLL